MRIARITDVIAKFIQVLLQGLMGLYWVACSLQPLDYCGVCGLRFHSSQTFEGSTNGLPVRLNPFVLGGRNVG